MLSASRPPLSNPRAERVRSVRALSRRSMRERTGLFLTEGPQAVREAVRCRPELVRDLYVTAAAATRHTEIVAAAHSTGLAVHDCTDDVLAAMADSQTPQGLLAVCRVPESVGAARLAQVLEARPRLIAVLSHVRDPGNLGTVIRAADAAGAAAVVVSAESVDPFGPKVVRSTAGSLFHLPVLTGSATVDVVAACRSAGLRVLAADGAGDHELPDVALAPAHAWVFGNEAWGLPEPVRAACDAVVRVPIYGQAESLNLAMAATVCLYASATAQRPGRAG